MKDLEVTVVKPPKRLAEKSKIQDDATENHNGLIISVMDFCELSGFGAFVAGK